MSTSRILENLKTSTKQIWELPYHKNTFIEDHDSESESSDEESKEDTEKNPKIIKIET